MCVLARGVCMSVRVCGILVGVWRVFACNHLRNIERLLLCCAIDRNIKPSASITACCISVKLIFLCDQSWVWRMTNLRFDLRNMFADTNAAPRLIFPFAKEVVACVLKKNVSVWIYTYLHVHIDIFSVVHQNITSHTLIRVQRPNPFASLSGESAYPLYPF